MPPTSHAKLSASSSHRWLHCTAAPGFEAQFPQTTSVYAQEGTLAHEFCEIYGREVFGLIENEECAERAAQLEQEDFYDPEMHRTAAFYAECLQAAALGFDEKPAVFFEVRVPLSEWIPEGFGTCDCCMIGGDTLHIFDYKHGKGVKVESEGNPQMRLYALGALAKFRPIYGDAIKRVVMTIIQPRISEDPSDAEMPTATLLEWGEYVVKPSARMAYTGEGATFHAGEWCRFCAGKAQCKARADGFTALEEFAAMAPGDNRLTDVAIADLLRRGAGLKAWYDDLQEWAREEILKGRQIDGWKVVAGRSIRAFTDADAAMKRLHDAGYEDAILYERKPLTLAQLEKAIGKKQFAEICTDLITLPPGKPTLVEASDKRPPYSSAALEAEGLKE